MMFLTWMLCFFCAMGGWLQGQPRARTDVEWAFDTSHPSHAAAKQQLQTLQRAIGILKRCDEQPQTCPVKGLSWKRIARDHCICCQHRSAFFLPWHRLYLRNFEDIVRALTGDNTFAMPYWRFVHEPRDHTGSVERRYQVPVFLQSEQEYPEFYAKRNAANYEANGREQLAPSTLGYSFCSTTFDEFGGRQINPVIPDWDNKECPVVVGGVNLRACREQSWVGSSPAGYLEKGPHAAVHQLLGAPNFVMGSLPLAAEDPVFWFVHANIDRLYSHWLEQHSNVVSDLRSEDTYAAWRGQQFQFIGPNGEARVLSVQQTLDWEYVYPKDTLVMVKCKQPAPLWSTVGFPLPGKPRRVLVDLNSRNGEFVALREAARVAQFRYLELRFEGSQAAVNGPPPTYDVWIGTRRVGAITFYEFAHHRDGQPADRSVLVDLQRVAVPNRFFISLSPRSKELNGGWRFQRLVLLLR